MALFDYQEEMVKRVQNAFRGHRSVMVQMPTGTGKTYLLAAVVGLFAQEEVWIVAHRRELVSQIENAIERFYPSETVETISRSSCCKPAESIKVMSIQWLSRHYREMKGRKPALIVVDEAHHAVANTYAEVLRTFPKAKVLGLTATPYRMSGQGFRSLFDVLLTSWSMERFIAEGRLSLYDYYSIRLESADQRLIDSLKKRGSDGDYQLKEMTEVMDVRPSLERLCTTVMQYVPGKKGIVYAISIAHAEHIAEFYCDKGIHAVAISSKTPQDVRRRQIDWFKGGNIQVLVSVDLFSEGFDCPDVEFIQLARPTLSLSKYLQMVGRGLRVAKGKDYCVILDNVGLYRRFGLPSAEHDWQSMFEGRTELDRQLQEACMRVYRHGCRMEFLTNDNDEMKKIIGHEGQRMSFSWSAGREIVKDGKGWIDQRSELRYSKRPQCVRLLDVDFCTEDGRKFYPRIRSKYLDAQSYLNLKTLELQVGCGITWKRKFIPFSAPDRVYQLKEKRDSVRVYADDADCLYVQGNPDLNLMPITSMEEMKAYVRKYIQEEQVALQRQRDRYKHGAFYPIHAQHLLQQEGTHEDGEALWYVQKDVYGETYWVDSLTGLKHYTKPVPVQRGFVSLLREGEWFYVRNIPALAGRPLRNWQIVADAHLCVVDSEYLFLKQEPRLCFKVQKRTDDFSYLVVKECRSSSSARINTSDIILTQMGEEGVKMECNGVPYTLDYQSTGNEEGW